MKREKGFTLIELLVVISIISLLSSVVLSSLSSARMKARDTRRISDLHQIQLALEMYRNDNNRYPSNADAGCNDNWCESKITANWNGLGTVLTKYISKLPADPINSTDFNGNAWNNTDTYSYAYKSGTVGTTCADGSCYDLVSKLEDPSSPYRCELKNYTQFFWSTKWLCDGATHDISKRLYSPQN